jgi:UDPglucose 6-dehydrogenase
VEDVNNAQKTRLFEMLKEQFGGNLTGLKIAIWGLSFKPNTDDMRDAPSIDIIRHLQANGANVRAFDPVAMENAKPLLPEVQLMENAYKVAEDADALILVTEWNEFKNLDLAYIKSLMKQPVLIDGRNVYDPQGVRTLGYRYLGIGRGYDAEGIC